MYSYIKGTVEEINLDYIVIDNNNIGYKINVSSNTIKDLHLGNMAKIYTIEELKAIIIPIAKKYGIQKVYLFGSMARGDGDENSDIDLRIEKGELKGLFALGGFYAEISEALQKNVDVVTTGSLDQEFLDEIKEDEVLLYAG